MKRRIIALCLIMIMCFSTSTALAATNEGVSTVFPTNPLSNIGEISIDSIYMPDKSSVYPNGVDNYVHGAASGCSLYTNSCFYGVNSIRYRITNKSSDSLTIKLHKYTFYGQICEQQETIPANCIESYSFTGLSSSSYYFIEFCAPSDFEGYVQGN